MFNTTPICFYHPITIVFLDDSPSFLDSLKMELQPQGGDQFEFFTNQNTAINYIKAHQENLTDSILNIIDKNEMDLTSDHVVGFDISNIYKIARKKSRFSVVGVAVIDYEMPDQNGLIVCQKLNQVAVRKLLLTAMDDQATVIEAFNDGVVDKYLRKQSTTLPEQIMHSLEFLKQRYFAKLSHTLVECLGERLVSLWQNLKYQALFNEIKNQANAIEYYLLDSSGSYLFLDAQANPYWLVIRSAAELAEQAQLLNSMDVDASVVQLVAEQKQLLFFLSAEEQRRPIAQWNNFIFDAMPLDGEYFYALIRGKTQNTIEWDKIIPYA
jgi:CheY-like chemotaxis protein